MSLVAINSNDAVSYPEDSFANMARFALERGFTFPYLHDETQEVARAYGAVCTPDFFGFDRDLILRYRGRLDASRTEPRPADATRELVEAMRTIIRTGMGPDVQHPSIGCSIKWKAIRLSADQRSAFIFSHPSSVWSRKGQRAARALRASCRCGAELLRSMIISVCGPSGCP